MSRVACAVTAAIASLSILPWAFAASHSVAAVAPDPQLARALDVALAPWGTSITQVHPVDLPDPLHLLVDQARVIARDTRADVVVWVSRDNGRYAVWIYDVASDGVSSRPVDGVPPFDPATAAAVALSVKALLRFTVVAPLPERLVSTRQEPVSTLGLFAGAASLFGQTEVRAGAHASVWPAFLGRRWAVMADFSLGTGVSSNDPPAGLARGNLQDYVLQVGIGYRAPLRPWLAIEPSMSAVLQLVTMRGTLSNGNSWTPPLGVGAGIEPALAAAMAPFGERLRLVPWVGLTLLTQRVAYSVFSQILIRESVDVPEGGLRAELALP